MPARTAREQPVARTVATNIAKLRFWRGLSLRDVETRTIRAGHQINRDSLSEIERGHNKHGCARAVTVDQLAVLAVVFRVSMQDLLDPAFEPRALPRRSASARGTQTMPETGRNRP